MISLDSAVGADKAAGATNWSYTHNLNNAKPKAVLVLVGNGTANTDNVSACTFGGVSLTRVFYRAASSAGDSSGSFGFFRNGGFDGLASGAQTVAITDSGNAAGVAASFALFADRGCETVRIATVDNGFVSNPSISVVVPTGRLCFIAAFLASGANSIQATSPGDQTRIRSRDYGTVSGYIDYKTSIAAYTAATTMSWTIGAFSATIGAVAIAETLGGIAPINYQDPGVFAKVDDLWKRRGRIFVPRLWIPDGLAVGSV